MNAKSQSKETFKASLPESINFKSYNSCRICLRVLVIFDCECQMIVDKILFFLSLQICKSYSKTNELEIFKKKKKKFLVTEGF